MLFEETLKNPNVKGLSDDSRKVLANDLFFSLPGERAEEFATTALSKGAAAVVAETEAPRGLSDRDNPAEAV